MRKSERLKLLLGAGYFPLELPPCFVTTEFATYRESILRSWRRPPTPNDYPKTSQEIYSIPTIKKTRRNLSIVNPIAQLHIAFLISENWRSIVRYLKQSRYLMSLPQFEPEMGRAIPLPSFDLVTLRRNEISALFEHALVSDVSRFYGTLYTHVIPWSLHGKAWCKANLNTARYNSSLGARLDRAVRKGQDNQTLGIPVGPDTSRVVAEIVGVAVDRRVEEKLNLNSRQAFRHIDDWYFGFDSAGQAEDAITALASSCREYELELNADKTHTFNAYSLVENLWVKELLEHNISEDEETQARQLNHFYIKAFDLAKNNYKHNVIDYAVKRTLNVTIQQGNWRSYETFLIQAARFNATVIPAVSEIVINYNNENYPIDKMRIRKIVTDLIRRNAPAGHHAEVAWALFLAKELQIVIPREIVGMLGQLESGVCGLLALDLEEKGLVQGSLDKRVWQQSMSAEGLRSSMWLLAYQADVKGWLAGRAADFVLDDRYFGPLKERRISFYDAQRTVPARHTRRRRPRSAAFLSFLRQLHMQIPPGGGPGASMLDY